MPCKYLADGNYMCYEHFTQEIYPKILTHNFHPIMIPLSMDETKIIEVNNTDSHKPIFYQKLHPRYSNRTITNIPPDSKILLQKEILYTKSLTLAQCGKLDNSSGVILTGPYGNSSKQICICTFYKK